METQMDNSFIIMSFYNYDIYLNKNNINDSDDHNGYNSNTISDNDFTNIYYLPDDYLIPNLIDINS